VHRITVWEKISTTPHSGVTSKILSAERSVPVGLRHGKSSISFHGQTLRTAIMVQTISPQELAQKQQSGHTVELIDVRTPAEYGEIHIPFARNCPLESFNPQELLRGRASDAPLYVVCRSGSRGQQACQKLQTAGHGAVINVDGGTMAWAAAGLPVVRGKKAMSLERQVRITAGLMVLTGAVLGGLVHVGWIGLSGFVGAGLIFAGVTDCCPMALFIARMPWNQVSSTSSKTSKQGESCCSNQPPSSCCN